MEDKKQLSYIVLLEVIVIIAGAIWGIWGNLNKIKAINTTIAQREQELTAAKQKEEKLAALKKLFVQQKEAIKLLEVAVPQEKELSEAAMVIEAVASRAGAEVTELTPQTGENKQLIIGVGLKSDFSQVKEVLAVLAKELRPALVKKLSILASSSTEEQAGTAGTGATTGTGETEPAQSTEYYLASTLEIEMPYLISEEEAAAAAAAAQTAAPAAETTAETSESGAP